MNWRFWRRRHPGDNPSSLGRMLLEHGWITETELDHAVSIQVDRENMLLGEILVEMGAVEQGIVDAILHIQEARRRKDVDAVVNLVCEQTEMVHAVQDEFINGHKVKA